MGEGASWRVRFAVCSTMDMYSVLRFHSVSSARHNTPTRAAIQGSNATRRAVSTKPVSQVGTQD